MRARNRFITALVLALAFAVLIPVAQAMATTVPVTFTSAGKSFAAPESLVASGSVVDTANVTAWVNAVGAQVDRKAVNATLTLNKKKRRLDFKASKVGYSLDRPGSVDLICAVVASEISTPSPMTVALPTTVLKPKITKFGKTILVSLNLRKIYLYDNKTVVKTYRCAVGQPRWPTPTGTFKIGKKVKNPSWTNGYASWSRNMPAYIGPGPNNPLGTRAMYVYTLGGKDTGVRFHGVPHSEDSSIGHAASHGCLRMHRKDVENFYPRVSVGTTVYIIK